MIKGIGLSVLIILSAIGMQNFILTRRKMKEASVIGHYNGVSLGVTLKHRWRILAAVPGFMERNCSRCPWADIGAMALDRLAGREHEQFCTYPHEVKNIKGYCWPDDIEPMTHPAVGLVILKRRFEQR